MSSAEHPTLASVRDYYGHVLQGSKDLKTSACCGADALPAALQPILARVHPEVIARFYGCGVIAPPALAGRTVLDLGCGSGRDLFVLSALVGPGGRAIGLDMTQEQLDVARRHLDHHARAFGHPHSNVELIQGFIEDLAGIADGSVDVVVSNCVINLSPDKDRVFEEIFRVLAPGGELHFSDVFADRRLPGDLVEDPVLLGECLAGALYAEDLRRTLARVGCADARVVSATTLSIDDPELRRRLGPARFESRVVRAFKLALEDRPEDYGQRLRYLGTLPDQPEAFALDAAHRFPTGKTRKVDGNTAAMLLQTRLAPHFELRQEAGAHRGLFDASQAEACCLPQASAPAGRCC